MATTTTAVAAGRTPAVDRGRASGGYPLGDLRAAVLRRDDQLHRSPGDRHPQADAAAAVRLERDRLRRHRVRVPARVRDRLAARRAADRSARHARRLRARDRRLEPGGDGARRGAGVRPGRRRRCSALSGSTYSAVGRRLHRRPLRARARRGRQLPGRDQDRGRVVPEARARARHRHLQLRHQHRRARHAARRAVDHAAPGAGTGRSSSPARSASSGSRSGCRSTARRTTHPRVGAGRAGATSGAIRRIRRSRIAVGDAAAAPPDVGVRDRQVHDRSDLVALPVLDSRLPQPATTASTCRRSARRWSSIYLVADVGSIGGGWLSSALHQARLDASTARARRRC